MLSSGEGNKKRNVIRFCLGDASVLGQLHSVRDGKSWLVLVSEEEDLFYHFRKGSFKLAIPATIILLLTAPSCLTALTLRSR